jgi:hypothetical protein
MRVAMAIAGGLLLILGLAVLSFRGGVRVGRDQAESDAMAGDTLTHALRLGGDIKTARLLRNGSISNALMRVEGDILLNATMLGYVMSPDSTDAATAEEARRALVSLDDYIAVTRSAVLSGQRSSNLMARSHASMATWLQTLSNSPARSPHGIAFDRSLIQP